MVAVLCELYPVETTFYTAQVLGMSETAVKNKAKELGIVKFAKSLRMKRTAHIGSHFHTCSFSEMGKELGISKMSVSRIAGQLGLKRSPAERHDITSRVRSDMIHRERRRVIFGLEPVTRIKVGSNRARVRLRSQLKRKGYTVGGAQVSEKHSGFVVNRGGATAEEVAFLIKQVQKNVMKQFNVMMQPEVRFVGFADTEVRE